MSSGIIEAASPARLGVRDIVNSLSPEAHPEERDLLIIMNAEFSSSEHAAGPVWNDDWRRVVLVNPGKFLGNLLIGGGLIQHFARWCKAHDIELLLVLDAQFRDLAETAFMDIDIVWYPRQKINQTGLPASLAPWWRCVRDIRRFKADMAFAIEEDSVCHQLTLFSDARYRISSTRERHRFGFHRVLPISRVDRAVGRQHMWFSYADVLAALGVPVPETPAYLVFPQTPGTVPDDIDALITTDKALALIHAGATKPYKRWPISHFAAVARALIEQGYQVVLIGSGGVDREASRVISEHCRDVEVDKRPLDLCDRLSLPALAAVMAKADFVLGNDSGPFHLAAALGVPGVVVFGPTDLAIWGPLSDQSIVLEKKQLCAPDCRRRHCQRDWQCLSRIMPEEVLASLPSERA